LRQHARHFQTGAVIPDALIDKIHESSKFNQGFATVEYAASALIDLDLHERSDFSQLDPDAVEREFLERMKMPPAIKLRHRLPHFLHVFSGPGYAAGYFVYLWAGVLDADGFGAFEEAGHAFAPGPAKRLLENVYQAGDTRDPMEAYVAFRGRKPSVEPLLRQRGFAN
jgi:peptidyl-dipeptidase Dcp